jgi:hypothetical protein
MIEHVIAPTPPSSTNDLTEAAELARALMDVFQSETKALATLELTAISQFTAKKRRLIAAYLIKLEDLREAPPLPASDPALVALRALNVQVLDMARKNAALLKGAITGTRRVLNVAVMTAAAARKPTPIRYRPSGAWPGTFQGRA